METSVNRPRRTTRVIVNVTATLALLAVLAVTASEQAATGWLRDAPAPLISALSHIPDRSDTAGVAITIGGVVIVLLCAVASHVLKTRNRGHA